MSIELTPATPAEIAEFKLAAARRYKERGIDPKQASAAFDAYMGKLASQFGIRPRPSDKVQKTASWLSDKIKERKANSAAAAESLKSVGKAVVEDVKGTKTYKAISEATKKKPVSKTAMLLADAMKDAACKAKGKKKPMKKKAGIGVSRVINLFRALVPGAAGRAQGAVQRAGAATIAGGPAIDLQRAQVRLFDILRAKQDLAKLNTMKAPYAAGVLVGGGAGYGASQLAQNNKSK